MKKKLSFLLAMVMILSLLPVMSVSAASTNQTTRVPNVADDYRWDNNTNIGTVSLLKIEAKSTDIKGTFPLSLSNAEWRIRNTSTDTWYNEKITALNGFSHTPNTTSGDYTYDAILLADSDLSEFATGDIYLRQVSVSRLDVIIPEGVAIAVGSSFYIPLIVEMKGVGESTVSITNGGDVGVTNGTYTFAIGGTGATSSSIASTSVFPDTLALKEVIIDELIPSSIKATSSGDYRIKLVATAGFEWTSLSSINVTGSRGLAGVTNKGTPSYGTYGSGLDDREVIYITLQGSVLDAGSTTSGTLVISGLSLTATDDARYGDVYATISGMGVTGETFKVGEYVKYGISITAEDKDLPVIVAGDYPDAWDDDRIKSLKVKFAEETVKSWFSTRKTTFTVNDGVKIRGVKFSSIEKLNTENGNPLLSPDYLYVNQKATDTSTAGSHYSILKTNDSGTGYAEMADDDTTKITTRNITVLDNEKAKFTMQFFLSVEPGYSGDITLTVGGDGVSSEASAVIAKAIAPFSVETSSTDVNLGYKNIPVSDILIKENVKAAIKRSGESVYIPRGTGYSSEDNLDIFVEDMNIDKNSSTVEVVEGDMILDKVEARTTKSTKDDTSHLYVTIKRESTTPSTIKISGTTISLDRTLPQGDYELRIGGIVCANYSSDSRLRDATFSTEYYIASPNYVRIVTPAPAGPTITKVSVAIGSTTLTYGENTTTMDVEPFIEGGYTMVPARWIAIALGLNESDISWNANNKTVTIYANNRVAMLTAGSNKIIVNGVEDTFDGPSVMIRNNRTFIPFRALGEKVMGVGVSWDEATRTATFNADV